MQQSALASTSASTPQTSPSPTPTPTSASPSPSPTKTVPPKPKFHTFGDGTYRIPKDVKYGTYRTREASDGCYWETLKGFSGDLDDIVANENTDAPTIVTLNAKTKGFNADGCGTFTSDLSSITKSKNSFGAGTYIVGTDMHPGTYRSSGDGDCYWERLKNFTGGFNSIIANDNTSHPTIVTIRGTDAGFHSADCGTWKKIS